jgi:hypothetical protein
VLDKKERYHFCAGTNGRGRKNTSERKSIT